MIWPFRRKPTAPPDPQTSRRGLYSTDLGPLKPGEQPTVPDFQLPTASAPLSMDSVIGRPNSPKQGFRPGVPPVLMEWYASQGFIGYAACAMIAQHWLVDKACRMPARDAIRQGYVLDVGDEETAKRLRKRDDAYSLDGNMRDLVAFGRIFGIRCVLFEVLSTDPDYYLKPFNIDGVRPGCYMGMRQIDPQWMTPELTSRNLIDPASEDFFNPSFWMIGSRRYHKSHFHFFVPHPVANLLKPTYNYGGVSVPQRIYERVYAAERTANEAPQLAMTKRTNTFQAAEGADMEAVLGNMAQFAEIRNNYGVMVHGPDELVGQLDTALTDFDALMMSQYQLVAASANVPATKLLGTTPKGFNATGEAEAEDYREELESIQTHDLTPLLVRHYRLTARSTRVELPEEIKIQWQPLDSPTATEWATLQKTKAETDKLYFDMQAIDGIDVRSRIREDREGDYYGLEESAEEFESGEADPRFPSS